MSKNTKSAHLTHAAAILQSVFYITVMCNLPAFADKLADQIANCHTNDDGSFNSSRINNKLEHNLYQVFSCRSNIPKGASEQDDKVACNWFVGQSLADFWGRHEFFLPKEGRYMLSYEIAAIPDNKWDGLGWKLLGTADHQDTLTSAEAAAASGKAVIAVNNNHIALILPGGLISSGWNLKVPRAAQLSINHLEYAFVGCKLSLSFTKDATPAVKVLSTK